MSERGQLAHLAWRGAARERGIETLDWHSLSDGSRTAWARVEAAIYEDAAKCVDTLHAFDILSGEFSKGYFSAASDAADAIRAKIGKSDWPNPD